MKINKVLMILIVCFIVIIFPNKGTKAVLESKAGTYSTKTRDQWLTSIRKMESLNGTLGLEEVQDGDLTPTDESGQNGLDIHMQKNTEYGAMAILSASGYGRTTKIGNGETTTGNESGVVIPYNNEWTAGQYGNGTQFNERYLNIYGTVSEQKNGDAVIETARWHGSKYRLVNTGDTIGWLWSVPKPAKLGYPLRWLENGVFGFSNLGYTYYFCNSDHYEYFEAYTNSANRSRAVIVNGDGI